MGTQEERKRRIDKRRSESIIYTDLQEQLRTEAYTIGNHRTFTDQRWWVIPAAIAGVRER
jgi:hypothetical protein